MNTECQLTGMKRGTRRGASEAREELLTQDEIAALLKVTVRTVERWQQEGVLPYLRMGHAIRFHWPTVVSHLLANFMVCRLARPLGQCASAQKLKAETLKAEMGGRR